MRVNAFTLAYQAHMRRKNEDRRKRREAFIQYLLELKGDRDHESI